METIWYDTGDVNDAERGEDPSTNVKNRRNCLNKYCSLATWLDRATRRQFIGFMIGVASVEFAIFVAAVCLLNSLKIDEGLIHIIAIVLLFIFVTISMCLLSQFQEKEEHKKILRAEAFQRRIAARNQRYRYIQLPVDDEEERIRKELEEISRRQKEERQQQKQTLCSQENSSSVQECGEKIDIPVISEGENCNATRRSVSIEVHNAASNLGESLKSSETAQQLHDTAASSGKQESFGTGEKRPQAETVQKSQKKSPLKTVKVKDAEKSDSSQAGKETRKSPSEESDAVRSTVFSSEDTLPRDGSSATDINNGESSVGGTASK